jgi:crotonobetainyl-CoA:carnitine CoA-transferase CaiB-like acyl-CoA transferase
MVAAAYAGKLMADLGAEVLKVEEPGGDRARQRGPYPGNIPHPEKSGLFLYLNTNKRGVTLDLETAKGRELFQRLVKDADVVVHNYHPTQLSSLGLEYETLAQHNPNLVMTSISPFGQTGPLREYTAHDLTLWSAGGLVFLGGAGGRPDLPPLKAAGQQAGFQAGVNAGLASLGALYARLGTGRGQHIDISVQECLVAIMENNYIAWPYDQTTPSRLGFRLIPQDVLPCRDGYIYVLAVEEHQWQNAVELMGNPDWADTELFQDFLSRSVNWDALKALLEDWLQDKSADEVYHGAQQRRVPFAPVSTMGDLLKSEHLNARGFFAEIGHPEAGALRYPGAPFKFAASPWTLRSPAPCLGQHNAEVYCGQLGLAPEELQALQATRVI